MDVKGKSSFNFLTKES